MHGDFAPWNIKLDDSGKVNLLDWENCSIKAVGGWDWLHCLIQSALLVKKLNAYDALLEAREWAKSKRGAKHLAMFGWNDEIELWIGSYLVFTHYVLKIERNELLNNWALNHNG